MKIKACPTVTVTSEPPIDQARFDELGHLITLGTFARFSGVPKATIMAMRRSGTIRSVAISAGKGGQQVKHRYYKKELAQFAGFEYGRK
jgi:hypothetical protein